MQRIRSRFLRHHTSSQDSVGQQFRIVRDWHHWQAVKKLQAICCGNRIAGSGFVQRQPGCDQFKLWPLEPPPVSCLLLYRRNLQILAWPCSCVAYDGGFDVKGIHPGIISNTTRVMTYRRGYGNSKAEQVFDRENAVAIDTYDGPCVNGPLAVNHSLLRVFLAANSSAAPTQFRPANAPTAMNNRRSAAPSPDLKQPKQDATNVVSEMLMKTHSSPVENSLSGFPRPVIASSPSH